MTPAIKHKAEVEKIVNNHRELIATFYKRLVLGYEDGKEARLYIDLNSLELFFIAKPKSKKAKSNNMPNAYELAYNNGNGIDLPEKEKEYFKNSNSQIFGLNHYLEHYLMPRIDEALGQSKG